MLQTKFSTSRFSLIIEMDNMVLISSVNDAEKIIVEFNFM